ncbi:aromatic ring-hydroxylating oxygenase subunit alpha [Marinomonas mediterranea]|jgi:Phenylpropionate dioxygenase and related ring-hydroxylating dioxygenases, large terminal subunit|uniref:Rieske (2Fe-2S) iron-sulfur domain n=1 Tax=Marinomonas mediterranea (strain ATCC 700492 / JCM 21426 / NBRC 103028 / MMB-1) TaxID=717774 RepID=F2K0L6_MARM1|nr:aromatic ring-hydroxylating dioxygenase subunit alpha [Marinomonas mediterranea]ADZ91000.1 Rieske (2Fe-2S) iron-sulfur domain [Marinomonas mediterranea MMB-1]WCN09037.1 Rieske 2Fe-2S domain-containing protein [Marinomonas mediterranea]WCN13070.1 Rieske 2Fe-2S domain-containing protein [Marinomonas mediterranea]WCN17140.1 Rieske 2Fe-2S domain-containing protein [Marinomonas mediterranea MMB-1]
MNQNDLLNIRHATLQEAKAEMKTLLETRQHNYSLDAALYNDPHMFRVDMEEVFQKEWLFVGMTSEIPKRGDYFTVEIGQNPVLIVRDADGSVNAFHNTCRHRGSRICTEHRGKVANLVCPYHQWTYDLKGNLLFAGTEMGGEFDLKQHGLKKAFCKTAGGFIFISLADKEPVGDFDEFLQTLEEYMEPYDVENTKLAVESNMYEKANWKLVLENNRECYHCSGSHPELLNTLLEWDDINDPRASKEFIDHYNTQAQQWDAEGIPHEHKSYGPGLRNRIVRMPLKKGTKVMTIDGQEGCKKMLGRVKNPQLGSMRILHLPNSWNHMQSDHFIVFRVLPISAQETMVTTKWFVHKDAVEGVDYDVERLRKVWDATNDQDRVLGEQNQLGINSVGYQPGPYSETYEFGVINFLEWYSETIKSNLA